MNAVYKNLGGAAIKDRLDFIGRPPAEGSGHAGAWMAIAHQALKDAVAEIESLRTAGEFQLAASTAETLDAERYRYLRNAAGQYMGDECGPTVCSGCSDLFEYHFGAEVDEVVDAALADWKAKGCPMPKEAP